MRKRAKTVQTPLAIDERQRTRQGIAWILKAAEKGRKGGVAREFRIAKEVLAVLEGNSDVFKWMEERHKVATANRSVAGRGLADDQVESGCEEIVLGSLWRGSPHIASNCHIHMHAFEMIKILAVVPTLTFASFSTAAPPHPPDRYFPHHHRPPRPARRRRTSLRACFLPGR